MLTLNNRGVLLQVQGLLLFECYITQIVSLKVSIAIVGVTLLQLWRFLRDYALLGYWKQGAASDIFVPLSLRVFHGCRSISTHF